MFNYTWYIFILHIMLFIPLTCCCLRSAQDERLRNVFNAKQTRHALADGWCSGIARYSGRWSQKPVYIEIGMVSDNLYNSIRKLWRWLEFGGKPNGDGDRGQPNISPSSDHCVKFVSVLTSNVGQRLWRCSQFACIFISYIHIIYSYSYSYSYSHSYSHSYS